MKKILLIITLVIMGSVLLAQDMNQLDPSVVSFDLGTTATGTAASSAIYRVPSSCKIDSIYIVDQAGIVKDATDTAVITLYVNNGAYGSFTTATNALTAVVPQILVPTAYKLNAGDILQFKLTKGTPGKATTCMGVTLAYHNTNSN